MRPALFAGLVVVVTPVAGLAQSGAYLATVTDPEVKLRAGPSDQFPETATLPRGATVVVDHEESNGWLAVQDPPGKVYSVSWVQMQLVDFDAGKPTPQNVTVDEQGATLRGGQIGLAQPLNVARAKVPGGTILTVIGPKVQFEGKSWYPVVPPAGDFRYLPKQAVRSEKIVNTSFVVRDTSPLPPSSPALGGPTASIPGTGTLPPAPGGPGANANKPPTDHPLWAQAEAAERAGNSDEAERLFFQLARVMNEPGGNHDIANLCYTRIHALREKKRAAGGTASGSTTASTLPPAATPAKPPPASTPTADTRDDRPRWTGPGILQRTAVAPDGRKTFALVSNGETLVYVTAGQGVDLEKYLNKRVEVYGVSYTHPNLKRSIVIATAVEAAQ
jgi:hypothetical protein